MMYPFNLIRGIIGDDGSNFSKIRYDNIMGLEVMLRILSERERKLLYLKFVEEKSYFKIAKELFDSGSQERAKIAFAKVMMKLRYNHTLRYLKNGLSVERYKKSHFLELNDCEKMEILKSPLSLMVYEYGLDMNIYKNLHNEKIRTIEDLYNIIKEKPNELLKIKGIGKIKYNNIVSIFNNYFNTNTKLL